MALSLPLDLATLPQPVTRILAPQTAPAMRLMAARGAAPGLRPEQIVTAIVLLAEGTLAHVEEATRDAARASLKQLGGPVLDGALTSRDLPPAILDKLAELFMGDLAHVEKIVVHPFVAMETIERLAAHGGEMVGELVATNEERLLLHPSIIEKLYMNKSTRMSTADRVLDLAVRNGKELRIPAFREAAEAIVDELILAPEAEASPDDVLFREFQEADAAASAAMNGDPRNLFKTKEPRGGTEGAEADGESATEEEEDEVVAKALPLDQKIRKMTVSQKIRCAMLGSGAARALLVRDKNKQVAGAVIKSPLLQENEVAVFAASRAISAEILRMIAANGEFTKSHAIKFNLCSNPKTPVGTTLRLLPHLRTEELKKLAKSKGIPAAVGKLAKQEAGKRKEP